MEHVILRKTILGVSLLLLLTGMVLRNMARFNRRPDAPRLPFFSAQRWFQPGDPAERLTPRGQKLLSVSTTLIMAGVALGMIGMGLKDFFE